MITASNVLEHWDDLLPTDVDEPDHPYARLSEAQLRRLARLARARWLVETGRDSTEGDSAQEATLLVQSFADEGLDAEWLLARRHEVRQHRIDHSRHPEVEGRLVTLAGLVLPLDWNADTTATRRFLFAPELSECSHEPPPHHSQVVHIETSHPVDLLPDESFMVGGDPCVVVHGRVHFAAASNSAFRVDGMMRVDSSYIIEPASIRVASAVDIARGR